MSRKEIVVVWRYQVVPEREDEFLALYGPGGAWERFFGTDPAYLGTELVENAVLEHVYLTLDRWRGRGPYETFLSAHQAEYAALDALGAGLTVDEVRIGVFVGIS